MRVGERHERVEEVVDARDRAGCLRLRRPAGQQPRRAVAEEEHLRLVRCPGEVRRVRPELEPDRIRAAGEIDVDEPRGRPMPDVGSTRRDRAPSRVLLPISARPTAWSTVLFPLRSRRAVSATGPLAIGGPTGAGIVSSRSFTTFRLRITDALDHPTSRAGSTPRSSLPASFLDRVRLLDTSDRDVELAAGRRASPLRVDPRGPPSPRPASSTAPPASRRARRRRGIAAAPPPRSAAAGAPPRTVGLPTKRGFPARAASAPVPGVDCAGEPVPLGAHLRERRVPAAMSASRFSPSTSTVTGHDRLRSSPTTCPSSRKTRCCSGSSRQGIE